MNHMQKLLVSIRGSKEAIRAAKGGAHIADVEYPASALGTPYPLNILRVRSTLNKNHFSRIQVSTNIGEKQDNRSTACQAALGVAIAGADVIKCGLAELSLDAAIYLGDSIVRTVRQFFPRKKVIPSVFVDDDMRRFIDPFKDGPLLSAKIRANGILIDTFNKSTGRGLLDYTTISEIGRFAKKCYGLGVEAWIAGSISIDELPDLWKTGVNVICVRGAACEQSGTGRFGEVTTENVSALVSTIPINHFSKI